MKQFQDYETISQKLMNGECPPEVFLALVGWISPKPVLTVLNPAGAARSVEGKCREDDGDADVS